MFDQKVVQLFLLCLDVTEHAPFFFLQSCFLKLFDSQENYFKNKEVPLEVDSRCMFYKED